ncbi:MAG: 2-oxoacid:ferredoxin oxidoreductase subunit beta [Fibrobacter sp.]|nr:2-oxoacid:ferredoxin oxidoreductase subunit beta [Fibrobacter sp.]
MTNKEDMVTDAPVTWCNACSFREVSGAIIDALELSNAAPSETIIVSGIGCSSRLPFFINTYGIHSLHGRAIPVAIGAKLANNSANVLVTAGDGDLFSIGMGHFVHAAQKNIDITVLCLDNRMYAMTKNQSSPTSAQGHRGSLTPQGKMEDALNVVEFAINCGASYVARVSAYQNELCSRIIADAMLHQGFSFVHILAPCVTFDKSEFPGVAKNRIKEVEPFDVSDKRMSLQNALLTYSITGEIFTGLFYRVK